MTDDKTIPSKCKACDRPMSSPVACDFCHALYAPGLTDYFTLLGVPRRFDLDGEELRRRFLELNKHAHPDFHQGESAEVQALSLRVSAAVNDGYRTLSDPLARAGYLLELLGGRSAADDKSVPEGFLDTMMMMQEELADAKSGSHQAEVSRIRQVLQTQQEGLLRRIAKLFEDYQEAVACKAVATDLLHELRQQINAVAYVRKLLSQT